MREDVRIWLKSVGIKCTFPYQHNNSVVHKLFQVPADVIMLKMLLLNSSHSLAVKLNRKRDETVVLCDIPLQNICTQTKDTFEPATQSTNKFSTNVFKLLYNAESCYCRSFNGILLTSRDPTSHISAALWRQQWQRVACPAVTQSHQSNHSGPICQLQWDLRPLPCSA